MFSKYYRKQLPMSSKMSEREKRIYSFLRDNPIAVLSSCNSTGGPHGAVIYYVVSPQFELTFLTKKNTRKHDNLLQNNRVMLTVFDAKSQTVAQISGEASEVTDYYEINNIAGATLGASLRTSADGLMPISKLRAGPYTAFRITPSQIRMAIFSRPDPGDFEEIFESVESYELSPS
jgi:hypothetical protein